MTKFIVRLDGNSRWVVIMVNFSGEKGG